MTHGTLTGYINYRCRCPECRAANAAYHRRYSATHREERLSYHRDWMRWWRREKKLRAGTA